MVQVDNKSCADRSFGQLYGRRLVTYVVMCSFLAVVNALTNPQYWWVLWVVAGWGLNLLIGVVCSLAGWNDEE